MSQITDPPTPYLGPINSFNPGHMIRIQGLAPANAQRFNINLQCGSNVNPRDDVALHLSVRLIEGYVARNTLDAGLWGTEQGDGALRIVPGQRFEVLVLSDGNEFKIAINGQHFANFPHRIPPSRITHLAVDGDVKLGMISEEGGATDASHQATAASAQFGNQELPSAPPASGQYSGYSGPPQGMQQGGYGGPPPQGGYGGPPPQGGYGGAHGGGYGPPPPPPGHQPEHESGFGDIFGQASSLIAGAISSGMAEKLIGSLTSGGSAHNTQGQGIYQGPHHGPAQYPHPEPSSQSNFQLPNLGGQGSLGGLGSVGSLLSGFAEQILHQPKRQQIGFSMPPTNYPSSVFPPLPQLSTPHRNQTPSYPPIPPNVTYHPSNPMPPYPKQQTGSANNNYPYQQQPYGYPTGYPTTGYPGYPGGNPTPNNNSSSWTSKLPGGAATMGAMGGMLPMLGKGGKKMKKSHMKKAMKYGLPIAGAGVGAYAISKAVGGHHGHHRKGGSSSSSSD